jgi:hypothetical protein
MPNELLDAGSFAAALNDEIREQALEGVPYATESECFAQRVLEMFDDAGVVEEPEVCVRVGRLGRSDWEIAGWAFPPSEDEDRSQLAILAILVNDTPQPPPLEAGELRRKFELAVHFVREMLNGRADELEPAAEVAALGRIIHDRRKDLSKITVHLATDGLTQRLRSIESVQCGSVEVACSIWDIERLSRLADPRQDEIDIDIPIWLGGAGLPCLPIPEEDPHYEAYLCVVPGELLYKAYEQYGQRLLELNVRAFLSATGKVNKGIRETIHHQPERFFPYNNGLALTARSVVTRRTAEGNTEIVRIVGLQVVNGGQTTASIHRAWKLDGLQEQVRKVFVQGKLTVITTPEDDEDGFVELVRSISKYANSQNAVKSDDLEANQPWYVAFEQWSRKVWTPDARSRWYFERARGSYSVAKVRAGSTPAKRRQFEVESPRSQLITKVDLAKAMNAWAQRPEIVSLGGQKNFLEFIGSLGDALHRPTLDEAEFKRVVGRVILFRDVTRLAKELGEAIPAYRANVVAYLIGYLSLRMPHGLDFDRIWDRQRTPEAVMTTLREWAVPVYRAIVGSADGKNVTEWCKKAGCWDVVSRLSLSAPEDLNKFASDRGIGERPALVDSDDAINISECKRLTPEEWEAVTSWSFKTTPPLTRNVRGVLQKLKSYALDRWQQQPTVRHARTAAKAISRWRSESAE